MQLLKFTKTWVDRANRGGLFLVNDEFLLFIRNVEEVARKVFNKNLLQTYHGEDLRDILMKKFKDIQ